jgi:hypothetical protein
VNTGEEVNTGGFYLWHAYYIVGALVATRTQVSMLDAALIAAPRKSRWGVNTVWVRLSGCAKREVSSCLACRLARGILAVGALGSLNGRAMWELEIAAAARGTHDARAPGAHRPSAASGAGPSLHRHRHRVPVKSV